MLKRKKVFIVKLTAQEHETFMRMAEIEQSSISDMLRRSLKDQAKKMGLWPTLLERKLKDVVTQD